MAEWLKAAVLKTVEPQGSVGSNPTSSARMLSPGSPGVFFFRKQLKVQRVTCKAKQHGQCKPEDNPKHSIGKASANRFDEEPSQTTRKGINLGGKRGIILSKAQNPVSIIEVGKSPSSEKPLQASSNGRSFEASKGSTCSEASDSIE